MKPNIIFMISDNQSPWTLGCYGNKEIKTPHIDRLAREGVIFNEAFCPNPVCSPNRASCLTGLMPSQHGVHNWLGAESPNSQMGPDAYCTIEEFDNIPEKLNAEDYKCGMVGKWHLGKSMSPQLGFDYWFAKPEGHTKSFYNSEAIWKGDVYKEKGYYTDAITNHAVEFIEQNKDEPFFLYVGFNGPYGLDGDMRVGHKNKHTKYYEDKELNCFPREEVHPWVKKNGDCVNNKTAMRSYSCAISGVDDGVGEILDTVDKLNLSDNTLIIYTADHGLCAGHHGYWGMSDHGRPLAMYDQNLRVPLIYRHPNVIPAGKRLDIQTCHYDMYPSILELLNIDMTSNLPLPGKSYAALLKGNSSEWGVDTTFHEYENTRTIRTKCWKFTQRFPEGPDDLYNLKTDPEELKNIINDDSMGSTIKDLSSKLNDFFNQYAENEFNIWEGGRSKAARIYQPENKLMNS